MSALPAKLKPIVDPDLERDLGELVYVARRIRQLNSILLAGDRSETINGRQLLQQQLAERADRWGEIKLRVDKLQMPAQALMLLVEEADRLYKRRRRRAPLTDLLAAVRHVADVHGRDLQQAEVDAIAARENLAEARRRSAASDKAIAYLEACR